MKERVFRLLGKALPFLKKMGCSSVEVVLRNLSFPSWITTAN